MVSKRQLLAAGIVGGLVFYLTYLRLRILPIQFPRISPSTLNQKTVKIASATTVGFSMTNQVIVSGQGIDSGSSLFVGSQQTRREPIMYTINGNIMKFQSRSGDVLDALVTGYSFASAGTPSNLVTTTRDGLPVLVDAKSGTGVVFSDILPDMTIPNNTVALSGGVPPHIRFWNLYLQELNRIEKSLTPPSPMNIPPEYEAVFGNRFGGAPNAFNVSQSLSPKTRAVMNTSIKILALAGVPFANSSLKITESPDVIAALITLDAIGTPVTVSSLIGVTPEFLRNFPNVVTSLSALPTPGFIYGRNGTPLALLSYSQPPPRVTTYIEQKNLPIINPLNVFSSFKTAPPATLAETTQAISASRAGQSRTLEGVTSFLIGQNLLGASEGTPTLTPAPTQFGRGVILGGHVPVFSNPLSGAAGGVGAAEGAGAVFGGQLPTGQGPARESAVRAKEGGFATAATGRGVREGGGPFSV